MSQDRNLTLLPFRAPWWLRGGHRQTLAAGCWYGRLARYSAVQRNVPLDDGDVVVVHDDRPIGWQPGDPVALLMHGLNGSHQSPLLVRIASKLMPLGIRVFRWDLRGCGAGMGLARMPYHAGCSDDLAHVLNCIVKWCREPDPSGLRRFPPPEEQPYLTVFGVSLSGNILLKYLGEAPGRVPPEVSQAIAVNPPIDLSHSLGALQGALTGWYDRHFVGKLIQDLRQRFYHRPDAPMPAKWAKPRSLMEFDDWYTAPVSGFATGQEYYDRCSAAQFMSKIDVPTTIITSCDDPMVPLQMFTANEGQWSSKIRLAIAEGGGHVGYIARRGQDPDEFWLDWRVVELMTGQHSAKAA
jgi:predicted alpha/beta-fold hydrolase